MIDENIMDKVIPLPEEETVIEELQRELEAEGFPVTNFNKGGIFYHLARLSVRIGLELKQLARTILNSCFIKHAEGDWLEIKAADYSKSRKAAVKAQGYVTIYREEFANALQITKGHGFKTLPDRQGQELKFYVVETTVIGAGEATGKVLVEAAEAGTFYNILPGKITQSMIHLEGVGRVENAEDWLYREGTEEETDQSLRERCVSSYAELATRTIEEKLRNAAKSVSGVLYARIDAQHPRGQGTVDVIITGAAGEASPAVLEAVAEEIEPLKGNYEDYLVKSAEVVKQDFVVTVWLDADTSTVGVAEQAEELLQKMMCLDRGKLNVLYLDNVIKVLSSITGYCKTDVITPETDLVMNKNKVIVAGEITVTVKNVERD